MNNFIFFSLHNLANQNNFFDSLIIFIAEPFSNLIIIFTFIFLLIHHEVNFKKQSLKEILYKMKEVLYVFLVGASAYISSVILKNIFGVLRPFDSYSNVARLFPETGYAFPSSHATFFMALALSVYFIHKRIGIFLIFAAILIGTARIIAGVHYPVDILGGYFLGTVIAIIFNYLFKKDN